MTHWNGRSSFLHHDWISASTPAQHIVYRIVLNSMHSATTTKKKPAKKWFVHFSHNHMTGLNLQGTRCGSRTNQTKLWAWGSQEQPASKHKNLMQTKMQSDKLDLFFAEGSLRTCSRQHLSPAGISKVPSGGAFPAGGSLCCMQSSSSLFTRLQAVRRRRPSLRVLHTLFPFYTQLFTVFVLVVAVAELRIFKAFLDFWNF